MTKTLKRRRLENKTDYAKRLKLLKGNAPRLIFRKTNRYIIAQYVTSKEAQDEIVIGLNSRALMKFGWPDKAEGSLKSLPASYLTGYLIGKKILHEKLQAPIFDIGMHISLHKTRIFAFAKGVVDAGVQINVKEEIFPDEKRIKGEHMEVKILFDKIKQEIDKTKW